jgi:hypothetical protein
MELVTRDSLYPCPFVELALSMRVVLHLLLFWFQASMLHLHGYAMPECGWQEEAQD